MSPFEWFLQIIQDNGQMTPEIRSYLTYIGGIYDEIKGTEIVDTFWSKTLTQDNPYTVADLYDRISVLNNQINVNSDTISKVVGQLYEKYNTNLDTASKEDVAVTLTTYVTSVAENKAGIWKPKVLGTNAATANEKYINPMFVFYLLNLTEPAIPTAMENFVKAAHDAWVLSKLLTINQNSELVPITNEAFETLLDEVLSQLGEVGDISKQMGANTSLPKNTLNLYLMSAILTLHVFRKLGSGVVCNKVTFDGSGDATVECRKGSKFDAVPLIDSSILATGGSEQFVVKNAKGDGSCYFWAMLGGVPFLNEQTRKKFMDAFFSPKDTGPAYKDIKDLPTVPTRDNPELQDYITAFRTKLARKVFNDHTMNIILADIQQKISNAIAPRETTHGTIESGAFNADVYGSSTYSTRVLAYLKTVDGTTVNPDKLTKWLFADLADYETYATSSIVKIIQSYFEKELGITIWVGQTLGKFAHLFEDGPITRTQIISMDKYFNTRTVPGRTLYIINNNEGTHFKYLEPLQTPAAVGGSRKGRASSRKKPARTPPAGKKPAKRPTPTGKNSTRPGTTSKGRTGG